MPMMMIIEYEAYPCYKLVEADGEVGYEFTQDEIDRIKRVEDEYDEVHRMLVERSKERPKTIIPS